ncbi:MAG: hypothetical protein ACK559_20575, partial [bacterium]
PTPTPTPTPTPITCTSGVTDAPFWEYYDCCGDYQSGSTLLLNVCVDTSLPYNGIAIYTGVDCSQICPTPTPTPTQPIYSFVSCCDGSTYNISGLPGSINPGQFYYVDSIGFVGCALVHSYN